MTSPEKKGQTRGITGSIPNRITPWARGRGLSWGRRPTEVAVARILKALSLDGVVDGVRLVW